MSTRPSPSAEPLPRRPAVPLVHAGIRYEEDSSGKPLEGRAPGGTLGAYDAATGQRLWQLQVYSVADDPGAPMPHPGRHFRRMSVVPGGDEIEIENEAGGVYRVHLQQRTARQVGGPPESAPASPPRAKPKPGSG